jgi:large subunit ribosomal protein L10
MAINKAKKQEILAGLTDAVKKNPSLVFVNFHKLTVANTTAMRRGLRAGGVSYVVAKKTLIKKALDSAGITGTMPSLDGEVAVAYSTDLVAPARESYTFQKKFDGQFTIIGGVFEGQYKTKEEMLAIATIPPLQTLYAQLANLLNSPIQGLAMALDQIAKKQPEAAPAATPTA